MAEYVSREKMMALFNKYHPRMATSVVDYWTELEKLPTEDVEPVRHGHWIKFGTLFECSECEISYEQEENYCPWCGARMDGEESV